MCVCACVCQRVGVCVEVLMTEVGDINTKQTETIKLLFGHTYVYLDLLFFWFCFKTSALPR